MGTGTTLRRRCITVVYPGVYTGWYTVVYPGVYLGWYIPGCIAQYILGVYTRVYSPVYPRWCIPRVVYARYT